MRWVDATVATCSEDVDQSLSAVAFFCREAERPGVPGHRWKPTIGFQQVTVSAEANRALVPPVRPVH